MSVVFTSHVSVPYVSKGAAKTVAPVGNRLVVTIAKADRDGNYGQHLQVTHATAVPVLRVDGFDWDHQGLREVCAEYLASVQDKIIAERIKSNGTKIHNDADIGQVAILAFLNRERAGDTWDAARIASWFVDVIAPWVGVKLLEVNPDLSDDDAVKLVAKNQTVVVDALTKAAKTVGKKAAELARTRLALVPENERDSVWERFDAKLDKIINPPVVAIVDALGF